MNINLFQNQLFKLKGTALLEMLEDFVYMNIELTKKIEAIKFLLKFSKEMTIINSISEISLRAIKDSFFYNKYSYSNYELGLHMKNISLYKKEIEESHGWNYTVVRYNIAISFREMKKYDLALHLLSLNDDHVFSQIEYAHILRLSNRHVEKIEHFKKLLKRKITKDEELNILLGLIDDFESREDWKEFEKTLLKIENLFFTTASNNKEIVNLFEISRLNSIINNTEKEKRYLNMLFSLKNRTLLDKEIKEQAKIILINKVYSSTADTTQGIRIIKLMKNTTPGGGRT